MYSVYNTLPIVWVFVEFEIRLSEKFLIMSGLYFHPPITIINSKKIIKLTISPTGI